MYIIARYGMLQALCLVLVEIHDERQSASALLAVHVSNSGRASCYKDEGNDFFKKKKYRRAVIAYTEGLKEKVEDMQLRVILLSNRAAAQFRLGNSLFLNLVIFSVCCVGALKLCPATPLSTMQL